MTVNDVCRKIDLVISSDKLFSEDLKGSDMGGLILSIFDEIAICTLKEQESENLKKLVDSLDKIAQLPINEEIRQQAEKIKEIVFSQFSLIKDDVAKTENKQFTKTGTKKRKAEEALSKDHPKRLERFFITPNQVSLFPNTFLSVNFNYYNVEKNIRIFEMSLSKIFEDVSFWEGQEELVIPIFLEVISSLLEKRDPDFSPFNKDPKLVEILFQIIDYLSMDAFQEKYLEPANIKFPDISLGDLPATIQKLDLFRLDVKDCDFSRFKNLKEISLREVKNLRPSQFAHISPTIEKLDLSELDVTGYDFSRFENLKELILAAVLNLTRKQVEKICSKIKILDFFSVNVKEFDFSRFQELQEIRLDQSENLTPIQLMQIYSKIQYLDLSEINVENFDFTRFDNLKRLKISRVTNLTAFQISQIYSRIESLFLQGVDVLDFEFSRFSVLKEVILNRTRNLKPFQISQLSCELEKLCLISVDIKGFNFIRFNKLKVIDITDAKNFTTEQFYELPVGIRLIR